MSAGVLYGSYEWWRFYVVIMIAYYWRYNIVTDWFVEKCEK